MEVGNKCKIVARYLEIIIKVLKLSIMNMREVSKDFIHIPDIKTACIFFEKSGVERVRYFILHNREIVATVARC